MTRTVLAGAAALLLAVSTSHAAAAADWCKLDDPAAWRAGGEKGCPKTADPHTFPDEIALPLPCGRKSVFRRITVPAASPLDHEMVWLGAPETAQAGAEDLGAIVNAPRRVPLSGGFAVRGGRAYYIGKYELPAHHWDLFTRGLFTQEHDAAACAEYDRSLPARTLPAGNLSWYDAMAFTRAWSEWLMAVDRARIPKQPPLLPWEQGAPAYVRVPTEAEWEYAARGGLARQEDAVAAPTHLVRGPENNNPRPGKLEEIAALSQMAAGGAARQSPLKPVGGGLPNLAGLYDTMGNVDEIVFDLFTLTRPDRPHGQAGGYVVKGGNVFTPPRTLTIAHRREVPFFDLRGERRSATTGFRPLLAPPVFVGAKDGAWSTGLQNPGQIAALQQARTGLIQAADAQGEAAREQLARLSREAEDGKVTADTLRTQLSEIQASLDRSNAELNARERDVLRQQVQSVTLIGKTIADIGTNIFVVRRDLADLLADPALKGQEAAFKPRIDGLRKALENHEQGLNAAFGFYVGSIAGLAAQPAAAIAEAMAYQRAEAARQGLEVLAPTLDHVERHVADMRGAGGTLDGQRRRDWLFALDRTRRVRDERFGPQE